jgi:3',5'-cyclic-AMP phosphodiesterase
MPVRHLVQITDLHIDADPHERNQGRDTLETLARVVAAVGWEHPAPELVLATGDLVDDGSPEAYARLKPVLLELGRPVSAIPGNHDLIGLMAEYLADETITLASGHSLDPWRIVMLDSTVEGEVHGHLDAKRLEALEADLSAGSQAHVLVVMHHQPAPIGSPLDDVGLDNAPDLFEVLDRHTRVRGLLWGHIHHVHDSTRNGVRLLGTPSTCVQFKHGANDDFGYTDEPPAFRRLALHDDGRIETEVVWVEA